MKRQRIFARLAMINVLVFLGVALLINLLASIYWDRRYFWKKTFIPIDEEAYTESFPNQVYTYSYLS